jgi:hypothetical protein
MITVGEYDQLRKDAENYNSLRTASLGQTFEEELREHSVTISNLDELTLELMAEGDYPAAGAWRGGFVRLTAVKDDSRAQNAFRERGILPYITNATIVGVNGVDVRSKSGSEVIDLLTAVQLPADMTFALDAKQWRRFVEDAKSKREDTRLHPRVTAQRKLTFERVLFEGEGNISLEASDIIANASVLKLWNEMHLNMKDVLKLKPGMILYEVGDQKVLGKSVADTMNILSASPRPIGMTFVDSPDKTAIFVDCKPTDLLFYNKAGKIEVRGFEAMPGILFRANPNLKDGDEILELNGKPFPGPYGYSADMDRLRAIHAPATVTIGRQEGGQFVSFDVRVYEEGMLGAVIHRGPNGRPYIKGFKPVPGPGALHPEIDKGDIVLRVNDFMLSPTTRAEDVEHAIETAEMPVTIRLIDQTAFRDIIRLRDGYITIAEAA